MKDHKHKSASSSTQAGKRLPIARGYTRDAGYVKLWRELYTCYGRRLGLDAIALWAFLRDHVNRVNGLAWPGYRLMQITFNIADRRTISILIVTLEAAGLIESIPAIKAIPDARDRREWRINDRAKVYLVHDPPAAAEFALLTQGRECIQCPFLGKCSGGQRYLEGGGVKNPPPPAQGEASPGGGVKNPPPPDQGEASPGGGVKNPPPVVEKSHHNKHDIVVVGASPASAQDSLVQRMTAIKVHKKQQARLLKGYAAAYLAQKLTMVERKLNTGQVSNPAGWFVRACQEDWLPPPDAPDGQRQPGGQAGRRKNNPADIKPPEITKRYY